MVAVGSSKLRVSRSVTSPDGREPDDAVVWLRGEHDISTTAALTRTLERAVALDSPVVVVDLSEVRFMSADTVGVLVRSGASLRAQSRALTLRCPPARVRRIFAACGLSDLLDPESVDETAATESAAALGSWVAVPPTLRAGSPLDTVPIPILVPEPVFARPKRPKQEESEANGEGALNADRSTA
jgi:anti-anti-sigma factor